MNEIYVIHVTKKCNMKCLYCYEQDKTSTYTWEEVKYFIDKLIENRTSNNFSIEFLGGEPMLVWDLIKKSYEYIEVEYHDYVNIESYIITTNGTILTDEQANYIANNKSITYAVSMDGNEWSNQLRLMKTGESSYKTVMKTFDKLKKYGIPLSVHVTTHPYNVAWLYDSIFHLYDNGIKHFGIGTIESTIKIDQEYAKIFLDQLDKVSKRMVRENIEDLSIDLFNQIKPKEDARTYIKDKSGKVIGESYGRSGDDITEKTKDEFNIDRIEQENQDEERKQISDLIYYIRSMAYKNHKRNVSLYKENEIT